MLVFASHRSPGLTIQVLEISRFLLPCISQPRLPPLQCLMLSDAIASSLFSTVVCSSFEFSCVLERRCCLLFMVLYIILVLSKTC